MRARLAFALRVCEVGVCGQGLRTGMPVAFARIKLPREAAPYLDPSGTPVALLTGHASAYVQLVPAERLHSDADECFTRRCAVESPSRYHMTHVHGRTGRSPVSRVGGVQQVVCILVN